MFDGRMAEGDHHDDPDVVAKVETYVNSKWRDLNIVVTKKPYEASIELPEDFEAPTTTAACGAQLSTLRRRRGVAAYTLAVYLLQRRRGVMIMTLM